MLNLSLSIITALFYTRDGRIYLHKIGIPLSCNSSRKKMNLYANTRARGQFSNELDRFHGSRGARVGTIVRSFR